MKVKINNEDCISLEEVLYRRNYFNAFLIDSNCNFVLKELVNNKKRYVFKKHIEIKASISPLCDYLIFDIKNTCNVEENNRVVQLLESQLSDGLFERLNFLSWKVEKFYN